MPVVTDKTRVRSTGGEETLKGVEKLIPMSKSEQNPSNSNGQPGASTKNQFVEFFRTNSRSYSPPSIQLVGPVDKQILNRKSKSFGCEQLHIKKKLVRAPMCGNRCLRVPTNHLKFYVQTNDLDAYILGISEHELKMTMTKLAGSRNGSTPSFETRRDFVKPMYVSTLFARNCVVVTSSKLITVKKDEDISSEKMPPIYGLYACVTGVMHSPSRICDLLDEIGRYFTQINGLGSQCKQVISDFLDLHKNFEKLKVLRPYFKGTKTPNSVTKKIMDAHMKHFSILFEEENKIPVYEEVKETLLFMSYFVLFELLALRSMRNIVEMKIGKTEEEKLQYCITDTNVLISTTYIFKNLKHNEKFIEFKKNCFEKESVTDRSFVIQFAKRSNIAFVEFCPLEPSSDGLVDLGDSNRSYYTNYLVSCLKDRTLYIQICENEKVFNGDLWDPDQVNDRILDRFDGIDKRFDGIDKRLASLEQLMEEMCEKLETVCLTLKIPKEEPEEEGEDDFFGQLITQANEKREKGEKGEKTGGRKIDLNFRENRTKRSKF